jgi:hypothetical protein
MKLTTIAAPAGADRVMAEALTHANVRKMAMASGGAPPVNVRPALPHAVYTIPLDRLAAGDQLVAAQASGVRMLMTDGAAVLGAVSMGAAGGTAQFEGVTHEGPFVEGVEGAVRFAETAPQGASASYEVRLLQVPALYVLAVWLHGAKDDLFVPVEHPHSPLPAGLQGNRLYTAPQFFQPLQTAAQARLDFDNSPQGSPPARP